MQQRNSALATSPKPVRELDAPTTIVEVEVPIKIGLAPFFIGRDVTWAVDPLLIRALEKLPAGKTKLTVMITAS
jgi:hypothetical protein